MKLKIREHRKRAGLTIAQLAERVDKSPGYMSMLERGANDKKPNIELLNAIASALNVSPRSLLGGSARIAVAGRVGAGAAVELVDAYAKGDGLYHIACPDDLPAHGIVAVEVVGESMQPLIHAGDVLLFTRHFVGIDPGVLDHVGICHTEDGRALVKQIRKGREPGTFDLFSLNATANHPEYGVRLVWAAPYRRHLRKEDVEIV